MGEPLRVLIVEDVDADAQALIEELRQGGYAPQFRRVETAPEMDAALSEESWDLILADYVMPEFTGLTALLLTRDRGLDTPFILVSGMVCDALAVESMRLGAQDYIEKGNLTRLLPAVTRELREARLRYEHRKVERELRESEAKYRHLFDRMPVGLFRITPDGTLLDANHALVRILGHPDRSTLISQNVLELCRGAGSHIHRLELKDGPQMLLSFELEMPRHDGGIIWVKGQAHGTRDDARQILWYEGVVEDITERKAAEEALDRRLRYDKALAAASRALLAANNPGVSLRKALEHLVAVAGVYRAYLFENYTDERVGLCARELYRCLAPGECAPSDGPLRHFAYARHFQRWGEVLADGGPIVGSVDSLSDPEQELIKPYGVSSLLILPVFVGGEWYGFVGFDEIQTRRAWGVDDIRLLQGAAEMIGLHLDRLHSEAELHRLLEAIEQAAEAIVIVSTKGVLEYVNPAFERITGCTKEEIGGRPLWPLRAEQARMTSSEPLIETVREGRVWTGRYKGRRRDGGDYEAVVTVSPVVDHAGGVVNYVAVVRDITRELSLEHQLLQAQKMEAIGQLAGGVAHDFNNLLQGITGYTHLAMEGLAADDQRMICLQEVSKAAQRAAALTRQLLTFSRKQAAEPQHLDLNEVINDMSRLLRRLIGEDIELALDLGRNLSPIFADPAQLTQVLVNLCVNARDAMPEGGRITIESRSVPAGGHPKGISGKAVLVAVSDTGLGIPPELEDRIFEPFFTTKAPGKGTGLGLSMVYGIVTQHGGQIRLSNPPEGGARFEVYLPAVACPEGVLREPPRLSEVPGGNATILVAEDEEVVRKVVLQVLQNAGYRVLEAVDGQDALELFEKHALEIDLAILDVVMPKMSGITVCARMRDRRQELPVLFSSAHNKELDLQCLDQGTTGLLRKPYRPEELLQRVYDMLRTHHKSQAAAAN